MVFSKNEKESAHEKSSFAPSALGDTGSVRIDDDGLLCAKGGGDIERWACLLVCFIEFWSIVGNILKPKGYDINLAKLVAVVFGKKFDIAKKDIEDIIEKKNNDEE